ncbi:MAG: hypothetical protein ACOYMD_05525 [Paludibacter sp.]
MKKQRVFLLIRTVVIAIAIGCCYLFFIQQSQINRIKNYNSISEYRPITNTSTQETVGSISVAKTNQPEKNYSVSTSKNKFKTDTLKLSSKIITDNNQSKPESQANPNFASKTNNSLQIQHDLKTNFLSTNKASGIKNSSNNNSQTINNGVATNLNNKIKPPLQTSSNSQLAYNPTISKSAVNTIDKGKPMSVNGSGNAASEDDLAAGGGTDNTGLYNDNAGGGILSLPITDGTIFLLILSFIYISIIKLRLKK